MAKNTSSGTVKVAWLLDSSYPVKQFPLAATLNGALDLTAAISWSDYELGASDSGDVDDRSLQDLGNAVSRGAASYAATLSMFRDKFSTDMTSIYVQAFQAFRVERTLGWLILRVNKDSKLPFAAGDEISVFKLIADVLSDDTEGEDSTKFQVQFLAQGNLFVHTQVGAAGVMTGVPTTLAKTLTAGAFQLAPVVGGASVVSRAAYASSDTTKASVSVGGTVTPLAAGTVSITTTYGSATAPIVTALTIT